MKKPIKILWILVILNLLNIQQARTQSDMHINLSDGTVIEIPINDIQKLIFNQSKDDKQPLLFSSIKYLNAENMHINLSDGTVMEIPIIDIQKLTFDLQVGTPTLELINQSMKLKVYPNPAEKFVNIDYCLISNGIVILDIFAMDGNNIVSINQGQQQVGEYKYHWETNNVPAGTYTCRIQQNNETIIRKVIIKN